MKPGDKVRLIANPSRIGTLTNEYDGPVRRRRVLVRFNDGEEDFVLQGALEEVKGDPFKPYELICGGKYGRVSDLRGTITYYRLSGRLANLIYSLNTTNTQFFAYQFKPVLQLLESPCRGLLIADEVGLGKTIEAGLVWTELRARIDARRLLVVCPAILREKWQDELKNRFGIQAEICDAKDLLRRIKRSIYSDQDELAIITSHQGLRPPRGWENEEAQGGAAKLAEFLQNKELEDPIFDMIVIDEAHYLRNPTTQTHKLGRLLRPVCDSLLLLSATPIQLRNEDLFHLLNLLDEDAFPFSHSFAEALEANAPLVTLRDRLLRGPVEREEFLEAIYQAVTRRGFKGNSQLEHMVNNLPDEDMLRSHQGRSLMADRLDRINPLTKVITRTRKREVQEMRVVRSAVAVKADMSPVEESFYNLVTNAVREFCEGMDISTGFLLTIPQRQMTSCMAAACRSWLEKLGQEKSESDLEETLYEAYGAIEEDSSKTNIKKLGTLLTLLVAITEEFGDFEKLKDHDTKYSKLIGALQSYWKENPGKKVILFSFYRETLRYLKERLEEDGVSSMIVQGGMDKHEAIRFFAKPNGPSILLSTEVAAEGVDLQFSSILLNYDLPWNPMRIEQRIGRIDRIGQEAERILIWNFLYANSIDDRIYTRLLNRLNIFEQALGSIETILGEKIRELGYELVVHKLTSEEEVTRIDQTAIAIENLHRTNEALEQDATQLIAHGDYIQNQVKAAREIGRYVSGEDLYYYIRDFFLKYYIGSRFLQIENQGLVFDMELSTDAKLNLQGFLEDNNFLKKTRILNYKKPKLLFENQVARIRYDVEVISQYHPLVRFVSEQLKIKGKAGGYFPVSAVEISRIRLDNVEAGIYVYAISRWAISGARDIERLEYVVRSFSTGEWLDSTLSETLINSVAMEGKDWLGVVNSVDHKMVADVYDACLLRLEGGFEVFKGDLQRENSDRIHLMINTLERHKNSQVSRYTNQIRDAEASGNQKKMRIIPAIRGKISSLEQKIEDKIEALKMKYDVESSISHVSSGVIRVY